MKRQVYKVHDVKMLVNLLLVAHNTVKSTSQAYKHIFVHAHFILIFSLTLLRNGQFKRWASHVLTLMPAIYLIWCKWYSSTAECSVHNTETDMQDLGCKYRNMFWKKLVMLFVMPWKSQHLWPPRMAKKKVINFADVTHNQPNGKYMPYTKPGYNNKDVFLHFWFNIQKFFYLFNNCFISFSSFLSFYCHCCYFQM